MKKILFIASHFYPNGSIVEAKNNYLSVIELESRGFEVDVAAPVGAQEYPSNVKYLLGIANRGSTKARALKFIRKFLRIPAMPIRFDDVSSILAGLQFVNFENYEYIYTVFGNGSEHLVGLKLKKKHPHLKWIAEFRDPWVHNEISRQYVFDNSFTWYAEYHWKKLEKLQARVLDSVDLLLVESNYHADLIRQDFEYKNDILICNGFSDHLLSEIPQLNIDFCRKPIIAFIGSTYYGYRDAVETFLRVLEELESEGLDFTLISIGDNSFAKLAATSTLKEFYAFQKVTYLKAQAFINKITFGLAVTMEKYPNHVNSKIFEYMQYNKPTLAIAPKGGAMDSILTKAQAGSILSYSKDEMKSELREIFIHSYENNTELRPDQVKEFDRKLVFEKIISAINKI